MKVMLRKADGKYMIYVAKKDLETAVVSSESRRAGVARSLWKTAGCWKCRTFLKTPACR